MRRTRIKIVRMRIIRRTITSSYNEESFVIQRAGVRSRDRRYFADTFRFGPIERICMQHVESQSVPLINTL